jgi:hypothetical protein
MKKIWIVLGILAILIYSYYYGPGGRTAQQELATELLLLCEENTDCIVPSKCPGTTVECVNTQCVYESETCDKFQLLNYLETVKSLDIKSPELAIVTSGIQSIVVKNSDSVAGYSFSSKKPTVICDVYEEGYITTKGCYETEVTWPVNFPSGYENEYYDDGFSFTIKEGETIQLTPEISIKYDMTGKGAYYGEKTKIIGYDLAGDPVEYTRFYDKTFIESDDWENTFVITFTDVFDMEFIDYKERVILGETATFKVRILNRIFDLPLGGYSLETEKLLRSIYLEPYTQLESFSHGWHEYEVLLVSDEIGLYETGLIPYFRMVEGRNYVSDERAIFGYYIAFAPEIADCTVTGCNYGTCQPDGICKVTQEDVADCNIRPCDRGKCDTESGKCIIYPGDEVSPPVPKIEVIPYDAATRTDLERAFYENASLWGLLIVVGILVYIFYFRKVKKK